METDSLITVEEIKKGALSSCEWGNIIINICNGINSYKFGSVCHVRRKANYFAHNLAKLSEEADVEGLWWWDLPPFFCNPDFLDV